MKHDNIVKYKEHFNLKHTKTIYIVMEYCPEGDLAKKIQEKKQQQRTMPEDLIWCIMMQIVKALYECHGPDHPEQNDHNAKQRRKRIIHRDLKPQNILFGNKSQVKLADFGLSRTLSSSETQGMTAVGSPLYQSPEQIEGKKYDEKTDIWSLGIIMYEMAALRPPFTGPSQYALANSIVKAEFQRIPHSYSDEMQRVIEWMLKKDPKERASVTDLVNVPQISIKLREARIYSTKISIEQKEKKI